jgi:hypothetical protein
MMDDGCRCVVVLTSKLEGGGVIVSFEMQILKIEFCLSVCVLGQDFARRVDGRLDKRAYVAVFGSQNHGHHNVWHYRVTMVFWKPQSCYHTTKNNINNQIIVREMFLIEQRDGY